MISLTLEEIEQYAVVMKKHGIQKLTVGNVTIEFNTFPYNLWSTPITPVCPSPTYTPPQYDPPYFTTSSNLESGHVGVPCSNTEIK